MTNPTHADTVDHARGSGAMLRSAREAAGLTVVEVAATLRMPGRVVQALEAEQWELLGAPVFVRGQLRSYARLLGVDLQPLLIQARIAPIQPADLVSYQHTPRSRRLIESIGRRAVYVVITAAIAVPVWLATRPGAVQAPRTASLDAVPAAAEAARSSPGVAGPVAVAAAPVDPHEPPYTASLTPLPRPASSSPASGLGLQFTGDSWVEIFAPDGSRLEKGVLKAGDARAFGSGEVGRIVLGNATAVEVQQSGTTVDTTPFRRANVARFTVSSDGSLTPTD